MAVADKDITIDQRLEWNKNSGSQRFLKGFLGLKSLKNLPKVVMISGSAHLPLELYAFGYLGLFYCESKQSCGECAACRSLVHRKNPNLLYLDLPEEKNLKVDISESLQEHLFLSSEDKQKPRTVILQGVERLTPQAANRLLKILEEPPENSCVIFTTSSPLKVLKTIHSRCAKYRLPNDVGSAQANNDLHILVSKMIGAESLSELYTYLDSDLAKLGGLSHLDAVDAIEVSLNSFYKKCLQLGNILHQDAMKVRMVRRKLFEVRKLRSALNLRLVLEAVFIEDSNDKGYV